uniref:Signal recognition particle-docking protein FtsY n=1 Tax=Parastrongyloides trichosuri TaxID=131310 RepID=A0A0N4ZDA1_PARTI
MGAFQRFLFDKKESTLSPTPAVEKNCVSPVPDEGKEVIEERKNAVSPVLDNQENIPTSQEVIHILSNLSNMFLKKE